MFIFKVPRKFMSKVSRKTKIPNFIIDTNSDRSSLGETPTANIYLAIKLLKKLCMHFKNSKNSIVSNFYFKYCCCI